MLWRILIKTKEFSNKNEHLNTRQLPEAWINGWMGGWVDGWMDGWMLPVIADWPGKPLLNLLRVVTMPSLLNHYVTHRSQVI